MKKEQSLDNLFALAKEHASEKPLVSAETTLQQGASGSGIAGGVNGTVKLLSTKAITTIAAAGIVATGIILYNSGEQESTEAISAQTTHERTTTVPAPMPEPALQPEIAQAPVGTGMQTPVQDGKETPLLSASVPEATTVAKEHLPIPSLIALHDLSQEELERIGILLTDNGIEIPSKSYELVTADAPISILYELDAKGYDTSQAKLTVNLSSYIRTNRSAGGTQIASPESVPNTLQPVILFGCDRSAPLRGTVTVIPGKHPQRFLDSLGREDLLEFIQNKQDIQEYPVHNRLVALHLSFPADHGGFQDIYVWYEPTAAFVEALPERHRAEVRSLVEIFSDVQVTPEKPEQPVTTLTYQLNKERTVSIMVKDEEGNIVSYVTNETVQQPNFYQFYITLDGWTADTYTVVITTENEDRVERTFEWTGSSVASVENGELEQSRSGSLAIADIFPNPARNTATIKYSLQQDSHVSTALFTLSGNMVRDIALSRRTPAGQHEEKVDLQGLKPGTYLLRMVTDTGDQATKKIVVQ